MKGAQLKFHKKVFFLFFLFYSFFLVFIYGKTGMCMQREEEQK